MPSKAKTLDVQTDLLWALWHRLRGGDALDDGTTVSSCRWCGKRWSKTEKRAPDCRAKQLGALLDAGTK